MDSGVLGLGAVAWTDAWNAAAPETGLRLSVDPARLLELLRGVPVSRALLTDLQRAVPAGRAVEVLVTPDRQVAEIATGTSHYVLTVAARNSVLAALVGPSRGAGEAARTAARAVQPGPESGAGLEAPRRPVLASGILWQSPSAGSHPSGPLIEAPLPWLSPPGHLQIWRDSAGQGGAGEQQEPQVHCAALKLHLPRIGTLAARIRVCGSTVAVSIECNDPARLAPYLGQLSQALADRGLVAVHVGALPAGEPESL